MKNRRQNRWSRIFVLLIFVMMAAVAADRIVEQYGPITFLSPTSTGGNSFENPGTAIPTEIGPVEADEYAFVDPTLIPITPTPTFTPTITPTPTLVPVRLESDVLATADPSGSFVRPTPLGGVGSLISKCDQPAKKFQYALYSLAASQYRSLTDSLDYLGNDLTQMEQAYEDGFLQAGFSEQYLNSFAMPADWMNDRLFSILSISADGQSILIERYGQGRGVYWLTFEDDSPILLLELSGPIEEAVIGQAQSVALIEVVEDGLHNLYFIRLNTGELIPATPFQSLDATHGRISSDGRQLAYETTEGVWVVNLDGSFASLAVPGATAPEWSPVRDELLVLLDGVVTRSSLDGRSPEPVYDLYGNALRAVSGEWRNDERHLLLWQNDNGVCAWVQYDLDTRYEDVLYQFPEEQCRSVRPFQFSSDSGWMIGTVPGGVSAGLNTFDVLCDLEGRSGCVSLQLTNQNYFCHQSEWTALKPDFHWGFDEHDEGWRVVQQVNSVLVGNGLWTGIAGGDFPVITSPIALGVDADQYVSLELVMRVTAGEQATLYFSTRNDPVIDDKKSFQIPLNADGEFHRYVLDLSGIENWTGVVNRIRIRPSDLSNAEIAIDSIRISTAIDQ